MINLTAAAYNLLRLTELVGAQWRFPSLAQRCSHIYNGADIALFARRAGVEPEPKQLLFVGLLAPEKGVQILLDAFRIVLAFERASTMFSWDRIARIFLKSMRPSAHNLSAVLGWWTFDRPGTAL